MEPGGGPPGVTFKGGRGRFNRRNLEGLGRRGQPRASERCRCRPRLTRSGGESREAGGPDRCPVCGWRPGLVGSPSWGWEGLSVASGKCQQGEVGHSGRPLEGPRGLLWQHRPTAPSREGSPWAAWQDRSHAGKGRSGGGPHSCRRHGARPGKDEGNWSS